MANCFKSKQIKSNIKIDGNDSPGHGCHRKDLFNEESN